MAITVHNLTSAAGVQQIIGPYTQSDGTIVNGDPRYSPDKIVLCNTTSLLALSFSLYYKTSGGSSYYILKQSPIAPGQTMLIDGDEIPYDNRGHGLYALIETPNGGAVTATLTIKYK